MTRIFVTAAVAAVLTGVIGYFLLPVLRALKAGQSIREIGPTWHQTKQGTPTMGGIMFIVATLVAVLIFTWKDMAAGDFSALFVGDLYKAGEADLIASAADKLDVDLVKIPHHGHKTSSSNEWGEAVSAQIAVATGYVGNRMFTYVFLIALAVGIFMWFLYNKTRHGKYMYAIGGNENAAEVAGVNCTKTKILIYMLAGILYGLCGFLMAAKSGGASVNTAQGYELEAIAGCTIGGVSVNGGVGKITGILIGVLVFEVLKIVLQFLGVESSYTYIAQGLVIIIAVALDLRKYLAKK